MDLLPVTAEYEQISQRMRQYAAAQYMEIINSLSNHVAEVLRDPGGIHDIEPGRLQAHLALVKLHTTLIKELGLLYRVQDRPQEEAGEDMVPASQVEELLARAAVEQERAVELAVAAATQAALEASAARERVDERVARERVVAGLRHLGR